jgi:hypothetical protein
MSLDFWNNPIVVSAFRLRYRKNNPMHVLTGYPLLLLLVGLAVPYYLPHSARDWPRIGFYILIGLQLLISGIFAGAATSASMKAEVAKQTLDFQRISCLSPRQILLGKLLGESAFAFLLAVSTLPLGVLCMALGGVSPEFLGAAYLNLMTHTLMCGALGLVVALEMRNNKVQGGGLWGLALLLEWQAGSGLAVALARNSEWVIPILLALPLVHLLFAFLAFHIMERRLESPLNPALSKLSSYVLLVLADLLAAGWLLYFRPTLGTRAAIFCVAHLIAGLALLFCVTPWRETLKSWVWRFRGRVPWWRDSLLGNRADNSMVVLSYCLIGLAGLGLFVLVPVALWAEEYQRPLEEWQAVAGSAALMVILLLALGTLYQWFLMVAGGNGAAVFMGLVMILVLVPHLSGLYLQELDQNRLIRAAVTSAPAPPLRMGVPQWVMAISPSAHFGQWFMDPEQSLNLTPIVVLYAAIFLWSWTSIRRRLRRFGQTVHNKLEKMGALKKE